MFYECSRRLFPELTTIINSFTAVSFIASPSGAPTCCLRSDPVQRLSTEAGLTAGTGGHHLLAAGSPRQGSPGTTVPTSAWIPPPLGEILTPHGGTMSKQVSAAISGLSLVYSADVPSQSKNERMVLTQVII